MKHFTELLTTITVWVVLTAITLASLMGLVAIFLWLGHWLLTLYQ